MPRVSTIVSTYNRSRQLGNCIASLEMQSRPPDEVVITDDGSDPEHMAVIREIIEGSALEIAYARQEHDGFRAAANRNNGARAATGDFLFFVDGDLVLMPNVVEEHVGLAEEGSWTTGSFVWLTEEETSHLTPEHIRERRLEEFWPPEGDKRVRSVRKAHRRFLRKSFWARHFPMEFTLRKMRLLTAQCSLHREDFERVNGYDENYVGWGREDDDLALRLGLAGMQGRSVMLSARALHQWHPMEPRTVKKGRRFTSANSDYHDRRRRGMFRCENGLERPAAPQTPQ